MIHLNHVITISLICTFTSTFSFGRQASSSYKEAATGALLAAEKNDLPSFIEFIAPKERPRFDLKKELKEIALALPQYEKTFLDAAHLSIISHEYDKNGCVGRHLLYNVNVLGMTSRGGMVRVGSFDVSCFEKSDDFDSEDNETEEPSNVSCLIVDIGTFE